MWWPWQPQWTEGTPFQRVPAQSMEQTATCVRPEQVRLDLSRDLPSHLLLSVHLIKAK